MTPRELMAAWRAEEVGPPRGWDFSSLDKRMEQDAPPWDLDAEYRRELAQAGSVLDMGTGGGEHLLTFADLLPRDVVATEGWQPNVAVAREALEPQGVRVVEWSSPERSDAPAIMPFEDERFDLVLNRHEAYDATEVARVLAPGGAVITQQVGGDETRELSEAFAHVRQQPQVQYLPFRAALEGAGLSIEASGELTGQYRFRDVAALVAYLQLVPWDVPDDFSVDRYSEQLMALHERGPARGEPVRLTLKRFWLKARKPR